MYRDLIMHLKSFNRKERFHLLNQFLGNKEFHVCNDILLELAKLLGFDRIPDEHFAAMDYHLDWIYAALFLASNGTCSKSPYENPQLQDPRDEDEELPKFIAGTLEDIDFIIVFEDAKTQLIHLILVEAKADTSFTKSQIESKHQRLKNIFGEHGKSFRSIVPHLVLCSTSPPKKLGETPSFLNHTNMQCPWIKLHLPSYLQKVQRCDHQGKSSVDGEYWQVRPMKKSGLTLQQAKDLVQYFVKFRRYRMVGISDVNELAIDTVEQLHSLNLDTYIPYFLKRCLEMQPCVEPEFLMKTNPDYSKRQRQVEVLIEKYHENYLETDYLSEGADLMNLVKAFN